VDAQHFDDAKIITAAAAGSVFCVNISDRGWDTLNHPYTLNNKPAGLGLHADMLEKSGLGLSAGLLFKFTYDSPPEAPWVSLNPTLFQRPYDTRRAHRMILMCQRKLNMLASPMKEAAKELSQALGAASSFKQLPLGANPAQP
jgi:hypothetical protein